MQNYFKFPLIKNSKLPAVKWSKKENLTYDSIDTSKYNIGIPTGSINNLLVVDVDAKDKGVEDFQKYVSQFGEPRTYKQSSPNGGYHYFFKFTSSITSDNYLIQNCLTTSSKYRGVGIDIRANGGYIVSAPSSINGKNYKIINDVEPIEIPTSLITFLLTGCNIPNKTIIKNISSSIIASKCDIICKISDDELVMLLLKLPITYCDNYNEWLLVTTVCKNLDNLEIWDNYSKKSHKYNYENNMKIWDQNRGLINVNYICHLLNVSVIPSYKPYEPLLEKQNINHLVMHHKYLFDEKYSGPQLTSLNFNNNDTIIVKSCTGTGKTTATAKHIRKYIADTNLKILSIISLKTLGQQYLKSFQDANIKMTS